MDNELFALVYHYSRHKFGFDWRVVELSAKVRTGVISRDDALKALQTPPFFETDEMVDYCLKKQMISRGEYEAILKAPNKYFTDYPTGLKLGDVLSIYLDTQANDPFTQANPSALFTKGDGSTVVGAPSVGPINGVTGPNFLLQSDGTSNFQVPEPTSMALAGLALAGVGLTRRRASK